MKLKRTSLSRRIIWSTGSKITKNLTERFVIESSRIFLIWNSWWHYDKLVLLYDFFFQTFLSSKKIIQISGQYFYQILLRNFRAFMQEPKKHLAHILLNTWLVKPARDLTQHKKNKNSTTNLWNINNKSYRSYSCKDYN